MKSAPDARQSLTRRMYIFGGLFSLLAALQLGLVCADDDRTLSLSGLLFAAFGGFMIRQAWLVRRSARGANAVNAAYAALVAGRHAEAEALWAAMPEDERTIPHLRRALQIQRTILAMNRGELAVAIEHATQATKGQLRRQTKIIEEMQINEARSLRALAQASLGHDAEANADAALAESAPTAVAAPLARASLARAVLLARAKNFEALHVHYASEGDRLVDALTPRERALSRALRRMGRPRTRGVYREAANLEEEANENASDARAWIRQIAPEAARFAADPPKVDLAALPAHVVTAPNDAAIKAVDARAAANAKQRWRLSTQQGIAIAAVVAIGVLGVSAITSPSSHPARGHHAYAAPPPAPMWTSNEIFTATMLGVVAVLAIYIWSIVHRARGGQRRMFAALQTLARKKDDLALAELIALSKSAPEAIKLSADRALASLAVRDGDFPRALADCERALRGIMSTAQMRAATQDLFAPEVMSTHAYALAAMDRSDEALAELAMIQRDYPNFPYAARASFRVHLMNAVRAKRYADAARISASRAPDMPVELRDDLLAELACAAAAGGLPEKEAEALRGELHDMPDVEAWLQKVAPGLDGQIARGAIRIAESAHPSSQDLADLDANDDADARKPHALVLDPGA